MHANTEKQESVYEKRFANDERFPGLLHTCELGARNEISPHYHRNLELLHFWDHAVLVQCQEELICAEKGDIVVINSNLVHSCRLAHKEECSCTYECLYIDIGFLADFGIPIDEITFENHIRDSTCSQYFSAIDAAFFSDSPFAILKAKAEMLRLIVYLTEKYSHHKNIDDTARSNNDLVIQILDYISAHYAEDITIEDISKLTNYSNSYICRIIKKHTKKTIIEMVHFYRCHYAKQLLLKKQNTVSEIARQSGFSNLSYFSKIYLRYNGELPSETLRRESDENINL